MRRMLLDPFWTVALVLAAMVGGQSEFARAGENPASATASPNRYEGKFCAGEGDGQFLRLIDDEFRVPRVPGTQYLIPAMFQA